MNLKKGEKEIKKQMNHKSILELYEKAVTKNARAIDRVESAMKWLIIMVPSKIGIKSECTAQGAYSAVNLLSLYHKLITLKFQTRLRAKDPLRAGQVSPYLAGLSPRMIRPLTFASVIEHLALFSELVAFSKGGSSKRWAVVCVIEAVRAAIQFRVFWLNKCDIVTRHHFAETPSVTNSNTPQISLSGARVTKKPIPVTYNESKHWQPQRKAGLYSVPLFRSFAEALRTIKPILTLALMNKFGKKSWVTFLVPFSIDLISQTVHKSYWKSLGREVRNELLRRDYLLLLYVLWSPLYETLFRNKALTWVYLKLRSVPIIKHIASKNNNNNNNNNKNKRKQLSNNFILYVEFISQFVGSYRENHFNLSVF